MSIQVRHLGALAPLCFLLLSSCSKKEATAPGPGASWSVNGQDYESTQVQADVQNNEVEVNIRQQFSTATSNGSFVVFTLRVPRQTGTYSLSAANSQAQASYMEYTTDGKGIDFYVGSSGTVTISDLAANSITGTFTFTGNGFQHPQVTKTVNAGKFKAFVP